MQRKATVTNLNLQVTLHSKLVLKQCAAFMIVLIHCSERFFCTVRFKLDQVVEVASIPSLLHYIVFGVSEGVFINRLLSTLEERFRNISL